MKNVYVKFDSVENADEFVATLKENDRLEEFGRSSSLSFFVSFPPEADYKECQDEVESFMWQYGYAVDADYVFN